MRRLSFPFAAIIGQETLKQALLLNAVNPAIGGVLIRGEKGTAKSTAVRALAELLPEIDVVRGCAFSCHPDHPENACDNCRDSTVSLKRISRQVRVIDLPLNVTEDRVAGGIDFSYAIRQGRRVVQPGLLASAHRGILYVDEVNLLDDHIVDIILDAAASGENIIEREGISFRHPAHFILVGTMNPEEGELRPQLLDRFGLCVGTSGSRQPEERVELMERREAFDRDPRRFIEDTAAHNRLIAQQIEAGRAHLPRVRMPGHLRGFICELCMENNVAGHRADLVMEQAARALAALHTVPEVTVEHISKIASLVLTHRRREVQPPPPAPPEPPPPAEEETVPESDREEQKPEHETADQNASGNSPKAAGQPESAEAEEDEQIYDSHSPAGEEQIFKIGETFKVRRFSAPKDRIVRRGSGRRTRTRIFRRQGRYVKNCMPNDSGDIALDATLRAAAPFQKQRRAVNGNDNSLAVCLTVDDIREKVREKRIGNFLLFAVDASGSMGARSRMAASKGAVMSLLLDAYQKRDKVALISFRRNQAFVNLPPTTSVELAGKLLAEMPVGGRTPLSAGLVKCHEQVCNYLLKEPTAKPIVLLVTDGKNNVTLGQNKPVDEALLLAEVFAHDDRMHCIVVDTEQEGPVTFGLAAELAAAMGADYLKINDLKAETLVTIAKGLS